MQTQSLLRVVTVAAASAAASVSDAVQISTDGTHIS